MSRKYWDITRTAIHGCSHVSAGCDNCWAARMAWRLAHNPKMEGLYKGLVDAGRWTGVTRYNSGWDKGLPKVGKKILFNCMGDLFHEANPPGQIQAVLDTLKKWPQHTFITPTKRPATALYHFQAFNRMAENMVLLASVEDQAAADERIPWMLQCRPFVRKIGLSIEPLLGKIDLWGARYKTEGGFCSAFAWGKGVSWVIVGAETGPGARPADTTDVLKIYRECQAAKVPVYLKTGQDEIAGLDEVVI